MSTVHVHDAEEVKIESDERGFELHVYDDEGDWHVFNVHGIAEQLYDAVKGAIGPWLQEMHAAKREYDSGIADDPTQQAVLDRIKNPGECPTCHGTGGGVWNDCPTCGGNGVVE